MVLPVVLVLSGTLAVTMVPWADTSSSQVLTASAEDVSVPAKPRAAHEVLREQLVGELQQGGRPDDVLTHLQQEVNKRPSLAEHCVGIARALGRAAVDAYGPTKAQSFARPVCDTSYASGVASMG
ncbi:membrane protein [Streptomyces sp. WM6368]|nr:membrane protein [Streptomyces sp. WM6368]